MHAARTFLHIVERARPSVDHEGSIDERVSCTRFTAKTETKKMATLVQELTEEGAYDLSLIHI